MIYGNIKQVQREGREWTHFVIFLHFVGWEEEGKKTRPTLHVGHNVAYFTSTG
jgi:hypothetical protein